MKSFNFIELLDIIENSVSPEPGQDRPYLYAAPAQAPDTGPVLQPDELSELFNSLQDITKIPAPDLLRDFGQYLFTRLIETYPSFIKGAENTFQFLTQVDERVFCEVKKRYPIIKLPDLSYVQPQPNRLQMTYQSPHPTADLVEGLIAGCAGYFHESIDIQKNINDLGARGTQVQFDLNKNP